MSDRTQDLKNLRAVATACKNYVDETKEQILWQVGQYNITTQDDNTTAYQKVVPTGATRAKIKTLGGMSYKSNNLANNPTITSNATNDFQIFILLDNLNLPAGTYTLSFKNINTLNSGTRYYMEAVPNMNYAYTGAVSTKTDYSITFTTTAVITTRLTVRLQYTSGGDTGTTTNVMLNSGSSALPYEEAFTGIRDSIVTSVKSYGANLWSLTANDLEIGVISGDGTDGSSTIRMRTKNTSRLLLKKGTYTISFNGLNQFTWYGYETNNSAYSITNGNWQSQATSITLEQDLFIRFVFRYSDGRNVTNVNELSNITLNYGSTAIPYKAYRGLIDTFTIPDEVKALEGYGRGINENCYNVLDLDTKEFTDKDSVVDLGTLTFASSDFSTTNHVGWVRIPNAKSGGYLENALCSDYDLDTTHSQSNMPNMSYYISNTYINIKNTSCNSASELKTALSGVNLQYELATYNITDNLELPNNVIEVEAGGYLVFENQYGQAVPSNITYRIEVAK